MQAVVRMAAKVRKAASRARTAWAMEAVAAVMARDVASAVAMEGWACRVAYHVAMQVEMKVVSPAAEAVTEKLVAVVAASAQPVVMWAVAAMVGAAQAVARPAVVGEAAATAARLAASEGVARAAQAVCLSI